MDMSQAVEKMRNAPEGTRNDTLVQLWHQFPAGTNLKPLVEAARYAGLSEGEVSAVMRGTKLS